jgi:ABC-type glutathione transport system ATPase component
VRPVSKVLDLLDTLTRRAGKNLVMVTHSPEVVGLADRLFRIVEGHLIEEQAPVARSLSFILPASLLSRVEFLGEMSDVLHSRAPLPLIPPAPFSTRGEGESGRPDARNESKERRGLPKSLSL